MAVVEHWWCPDCCAFDGPITDGCCDVCDLMDEHSSGVVRLVPASALDEARADLNDLNDQYQELRIEADEARAEVDRLADALHDLIDTPTDARTRQRARAAWGRYAASAQTRSNDREAD